MIRVLVNGAKGRMGQEAVKAIENDPALSLVAQCDVDDDLEREIKRSKAQVVVDFTTAHSALENAKKILHAGVCPVIGTSGFRIEEVQKLQAIAADKKIGGVIAPNFALGAVLLMKFATEAARYLPHVEIIELHHNAKADSPSGTAVRTAEMIAHVRERPQTHVHEKAILPHARGAELDGIHIHSIRIPGLVAHQEVIFGGVGQTLTIRHDSLNRESFMPGVCLAAKKVPALDKLYYGLEHLL